MSCCGSSCALRRSPRTAPVGPSPRNRPSSVLRDAASRGLAKACEASSVPSNPVNLNSERRSARPSTRGVGRRGTSPCRGNTPTPARSDPRCRPRAAARVHERSHENGFHERCRPTPVRYREQGTLVNVHPRSRSPRGPLIDVTRSQPRRRLFHLRCPSGGSWVVAGHTIPPDRGSSDLLNAYSRPSGGGPPRSWSACGRSAAGGSSSPSRGSTRRPPARWSRRAGSACRRSRPPKARARARGGR